MGVSKRAIAAGIVLFASSLGAQAADYKAEYDKKIKAAQDVGVLGSDLAGDSTNFYTGATSFSATDISIPGNSGLAVSLSRNYTVEYNHAKSVVDGGSNQTPELEEGVKRLFGDWDLDIPHISAVMTQANGWVIDSTTPLNRCSVIGQNNAANTAAATGAPGFAEAERPGFSILTFEAAAYWHGYNLHLPGGDQSLLLASLTNNERPSTGGPYHWTTNKDWWVSCLSSTANNAGGEGFLAIGPDGTKYTFNWLTKRNVDSVSYVEDLRAEGGQLRTHYLFRAEYLMLPTRIEDRFGNWVVYSWSNDAFARLQSVTSGPVGTTTPDRTLTLSYNGDGFVSSATDGTRTWTYTYNGHTLSEVILPDTSKWQYNFGNVDLIDAPEPKCYWEGPPDTPEYYYNCFGNGEAPSTAGTAYVIHPSGARVDFVFDNHFQMGNSVNTNWSYPLGIVSKTISGPGMATATWKYGFGPTLEDAREACFTNSDCPDTLWADELAPDGQVTRRIYGLGLNANEGLSLATFSGNSSASAPSAGTSAITCVANCEHFGKAMTMVTPATVPVFYQQQHSTYVPASPAPSYVVRVGVNPLFSYVTPVQTYWSERRLPVQVSSSQQQGVTFTSTTNSFNAYAQPTSVTRANTGSAGGNNSRTETMSYVHDTAKWVIGQLATTTDVATGKVISQTDYDSTTRLPWKTYSFGLLQNTMTYNANGTLATVKDGLNNTISLSNWYRGIPQRIDYPTSVYETATVNGLGQITGTTDELGYSHSYGYDSLGRLSSITYPTGDTNTWAGLSRTFVPVASTEYGLGAGHWKQTVQTGNGKATTYYDALWRPVLVLTEDTGNAASKSFVVTRYDSSGRPVFKSYAVGSLTTVNDTLTGVTTTYDALGRPYQVKQDAEAPLNLLTTTTEYLAGFITRVTNPRGYVSETKYQLFGSPSTDAPVEIVTAKGQTEQQTTTIVRDGFGKPLSVTRSGAAP